MKFSAFIDSLLDKLYIEYFFCWNIFQVIYNPIYLIHISNFLHFYKAKSPKDFQQRKKKYWVRTCWKWNRSKSLKKKKNWRTYKIIFCVDLLILTFNKINYIFCFRSKNMYTSLRKIVFLMYNFKTLRFWSLLIILKIWKK